MSEDVKKVQELFKEVKKIFSEASDKDAKEILKEIQWFQRIHFEL